MSSVLSIGLPQEILVDDIFPKLSSLDLIKSSCVCRLWRQLAFDPKLWKCFVSVLDKKVYEAKFGDIKSFGLSIDDLTPISDTAAIGEAARFLADLKRASLTVKEDAGVMIVDVPRMTSFKSLRSLLQRRVGNGLLETDFTRILNSQLREYSFHRSGSSRFMITTQILNESLNKSKEQQLALLRKARGVEMPSLVEAHLVHVLLNSPLPESIHIAKSGMGQEFGDYLIHRQKEPNEALDFYDREIQQVGIVAVRRLVNHDSALRTLFHRFLRTTPWKKCFLFTLPVIVYHIANIHHWIVDAQVVDRNGTTLVIVVLGAYYYIGLIICDLLCCCI